jgi:hypothetical protein
LLLSLLSLLLSLAKYDGVDSINDDDCVCDGVAYRDDVAERVTINGDGASPRFRDKEDDGVAIPPTLGVVIDDNDGDTPTGPLVIDDDAVIVVAATDGNDDAAADDDDDNGGIGNDDNGDDARTID